MKKVICISKNNSFLTIGKEYTLLGTGSKTFYKVVDDFGCYRHYPKYCFITLEKQRTNTINNILK